MVISHMEVEQLGPFRERTAFDFDQHANVLIGPNNSGKSTIVMALAESIVVPFTIPLRLYRTEARPHISLSTFEAPDEPLERDCPIQVDSEFVHLMKRAGYTCFVPALRRNQGFRPKTPMGAGTYEERYTREGRVRRRRRHTEDDPYPGLTVEEAQEPRVTIRGVTFSREGSPADEDLLTAEDRTEVEKRASWLSNSSLITDEVIVGKIVELDYRSYRKHDERFRKTIETITDITNLITEDFHIKFLGIEEDERGLFPQFSTPDGSLPLDKLSQGTQSIVQWVSHLVLGMAEYYDFPDDLTDRKAVFIIDEIDAHMHPRWQRKLIPAIVEHFPNCQLFATTHSPLVLSGLSAGQVHLLDRSSPDTSPYVQRNEQAILGWSVDEILRWLMGFSGTLDWDTENRAEELANLRAQDHLDPDEEKRLAQLRKEIAQRLRSGPEDQQS